MSINPNNGSLIEGGLGKSKATSLLDIGIAIRPCNPDAIPGLLKQLSSFGGTPPVERDDTRLSMLTSARALVRALETPRETMIKHNWAQPGCHATITSCYNAGVFSTMGDEPMRVDEIASKVGKPREVLARSMKHIAAMGYVIETDTDEYAHTNFSKALSIPVIGDGYPVLAGGAHPSCSKFAEYLQMTNYATPSDSKIKPYQYTFNTDMNMFEYLHAHPPMGKQFDHHMGGYRQGRPSWMDSNFYPVEERLIKDMDTNDDAVLLVDIGGGLGHDLTEFITKIPHAPGRLVLQDLPMVIDSIEQLHERIEPMTHDFLTEQPLKAARAYYMHSVLHDWPDEVCANILRQVVGAMKPGYSRLLVNENVIPDKGADWQATALDMIMLTLFASKERTLAEWKQLFESVGLRVVEIWRAEHSQESLIECELA